MNYRRFHSNFVLVDYISAFLSCLLFSGLNWTKLSHDLFVNESTLLRQILLFSSPFWISAYWILLFKIFGYYRNTIRKFRMEVAGDTVVHTFFGGIFILVLGFILFSGKNFPGIFLWIADYLLVQFVVSLLCRMVLTSFLIRLKRKGVIFFKALIVGRSGMITPILDELRLNYANYGNKILGYVLVDNIDPAEHEFPIENLGMLEQLSEIVRVQKIEDVIIVLKSTDMVLYRQIMEQLYGADVFIKINTELYPMFMGRTDVSALFYYPLINIPRETMTSVQMITKRLVDIIVSGIALLILFPFCLILIVLIKLGSKGPIIYSHERIGRNGKPFKIFKFRSMVVDAEKNGPQLSSKNDSRITNIGFFMRRLRLDKIPNLVNVLIGDMSLVGPRPERQYFINQIIERAPEFKRLLMIKPGVTSWGQVRYGYAENVDEMIRRMHYDLLYLENMSLIVDFQILFRTIFIILQGRGI